MQHSHYYLKCKHAFSQVSKTSAKDDKNNVINGFKKSLSSKQAPPKLLKLKPEDQAIVVSIRKESYLLMHHSCISPKDFSRCSYDLHFVCHVNSQILSMLLCADL